MTSPIPSTSSAPIVQATPTMIGSIDVFHVGKSFSNWVERFEILCALHNVAADTKRSWFISLSGEEVFDEIKLLFPKQEVNTLAYDDIIKKLKSRFDRTEPALMHRYKFYNRSQGPSESSENFVLAVKLLAENCNFKTFKDEAVRDKLILGLRDKVLQQKLLMEEDIALDTVEKTIISTELAGKRAKDIIENSDSEVLSIKHRLGRKQQEENNNKREHKSNYRSRSVSSERGNNSKEKNSYRMSRDTKQWGSHSNAVCNLCKRRGHIRKNCWFLNKKNTVKFLEQEDQETEQETTPPVVDKFNRMNLQDSGEDSDINCMKISGSDESNACLVEATVNGRQLIMEIDTGSAVTVISEYLYKKMFSSLLLSGCNKKLVVVSGAKLEVVGQFLAHFLLNGRKAEGRLIVLKTSSEFKPLLGRDLMGTFFPNWKNNFTTATIVKNLQIESKHEEAISMLKKKYSSVFSNDLSQPISGFEADLVFKPNQPIFRKPYQVPYKIKEKFLDHLDGLERQGVITPIKASEWAAPVIAIVKKDNDLRMVIDCKVSLNKIIIPNTYPLPLAQDIFASLAGSKVFCSLDLTGAYTQLKLSKRSQKYVVINTEKGLYTYNRLPQGASSSAAVFQQVMDQILRGLKNVSVYLDDVLISAENFQECLDKVEQVLARLASANISVNFKKCKFFVSSLQYLGHVISSEGLLPSPEKLSTIKEAKVPQNVTELKAYLGLINYYNKFVPNLSSKLRNLYALLKKNTVFKWTEECDEAFKVSKKSLLNANLLTFYDPKKPLVVVTDASSYGLGGVLGQIEDNMEKPICFTSFSLNDAQKRYPILHLEALALVCVIKKFHKFLFGQKFKIYTDHKPLLGIFGKEGKHSLYVTRLQRYIMELSIYDFEIEYRPAAKMGNADFCSRFPIDQKVPAYLDQDAIKSLNFSNEFPLDYSLISKETKQDIILSQLINFVTTGWPKNVPKPFKNYFAHKEKLEVVEEILLLEDKVIIPEILKTGILKLLHANHGGMVQMKKIARRAVYWPDMNSDIESFVKRCGPCAQMEIVPKPKDKGSWIPTTRPFSRIHADFFYFQGKNFLLIVDSFSKWIEVEWIRTKMTATIINRKFASLIARCDLPDVVVTDGGPPFNSSEFVDFLKLHKVKVLKSPPYNPPSNGQAERLVRTVKDVFKKFLIDNQTKSLDIEDKLNLFLINYRNSFHGEEGTFPSEKVLGFKPKMLLDLINPRTNYKNYLDKSFKKDDQPEPIKDYFPDGLDKLKAGDKLLYKNTNTKEFRRWLDAKFVKRISTNVFQIALGSHVLTAHRNQLKMVAQTYSRVKVMIPGTSKARRQSLEEQEDFLGFPEADETPNKDLRGLPEMKTVQESRPVEDTAEAVRAARKRKFVERSPIRTRSKMRRVVQ